MEVIRLRALRGPNLWSRHTAIEALVRCEPAERHITALNGFEARVRALFPAIGEQWAGGAGRTLALAQVLEVAALALQAAAGCRVTFSRTTATVEAGVYQVVVEYTEEAVGRLAFDLAQALLQAAREDSAFDVADAVARLRALDEDVRLGPSTGSIVDAAVARGIPYRRLTEGSLVQFGWGVKQRRIWAAEVDATSAVSESIAQDKDLTKVLLQAAGVPVPTGQPVADHQQPEVVAGQELLDHHGADLVGRAVGDLEVLAIDDVDRHALALVAVLGLHDDRLVAAARRDPPHVIGDGVHTVQQLVGLVNADPRRGDGHATALTKIRFDEIDVARLATQGLAPESVPDKGRRVVLRNNANLSTGGTATDVTDEVHAEVAARAVAAARMVGLHVCGVDVVCETVGRPLEKQSGGVVEVNAAPGLRMHLSPSYGKGRNVGEAIVADLYAPGDDGRIPVVAVTGTNGKTTVTRLIAHLLAQSGLTVGMTNTDGVYVDGRTLDRGDCSGPKSARSVLMHPDVEAAVFETARGGLLREGLAFDRCRVAVVTNVGEGDHLGLNYITTVEDVAVLKRVIVHNVAPDGWAVLNAADPLVAEMATVCPGKVIWFAADRHHPVMRTQRAQGGRKVYVEAGADGRPEIVAAEGAWRERVPLADVPLTRGGRIGFQVENAMAAVAAAWAVGLPWDTIRSGLASFVADSDNAPGRFNLMDYKGATVIADYGHNPDAMRALVQAVEALPAKRRSVVISGAGDRRDEDIRAQTAILGAAFDEVLLYQDAAQRGRGDGEVIALLREGRRGASRTTRVDEIRGEFVAIDTALERLAPGDLCLVLIDQVDEALAHLQQRCAAA